MTRQEPKTGHWIAEIDDYGEVIGWHCDKCYEDSGFTTDCKWNFCPNCGERMVEPQKSEEENNMTIGIDMYMEIDEKAKDEVKAMLMHHIEQIMSLDEWPEIKSVYGVEVREIEE